MQYGVFIRREKNHEKLNSAPFLLVPRSWVSDRFGDSGFLALYSSFFPLMTAPSFLRTAFHLSGPHVVCNPWHWCWHVTFGATIIATRDSGLGSPWCLFSCQALIRRRSTEPNLKHCKRNEKQSWDLLLNWCLKNSNWLIDWNWKLHTKCNWKCCNCENWWNLLCQWKQDITNTQNNKNEIFAIIIRTVYLSIFINIH